MQILLYPKSLKSSLTSFWYIKYVYGSQLGMRTRNIAPLHSAFLTVIVSIVFLDKYIKKQESYLTKTIKKGYQGTIANFSYITLKHKSIRPNKLNYHVHRFKVCWFLLPF